MRKKLRTGSLAIVVAFAVSACGGDDKVESLNETPPELTQPFAQVVAFGDSLSDAGTFNPTTADTDPSNDSATGLPFTTKPGSTWAVYVAANLGIQLKPNQQVNFGIVGNGGAVTQVGGLDYAEGGARIDVDPANAGVVTQTIPGVGAVSVQLATSRSIKTQIDDYLSEHANAFSDNQLVLIQGGANEFFNFLAQVAGNPSLAANASAVVSATATSMITQVGRLRAANATQIIYSNLPDLGQTPQFRTTPLASLATQMTAAYNNAVRDQFAAWGVTIFDTSALIDAVVASPATYGFSNVTTPACTSTTTPGNPATLSALICSPTTLVTPDADITHLFADGVHPTARAHALWADQVTHMPEAVIELH
ncbi:MAG: SGNH/GDSL hydrolase family protein [Povalibacter sp.]